jgi:hypothetical protein
MRHHAFSSLPLVALLLALSPAALASNIWYVDGVHGNDNNNCKSRQTACKTIGHAISLASSDDSIIVATAIYKETLTINFSLKIFGSNARTTIIDGSGYGNVVYVPTSSARVGLSKLTIRNGAGIANSGTLTVSYSTIKGNSAYAGGGISNSGTMTLNRCTVSGNMSVGIDGYYSNAGGIDNEGMLTINDSTISENSTDGNYVCGGGIYSTGTLIINNSTLTNNHANGASNSNGGGIDNEGGTVVLSNSTLSGNSATIYGGDGYGGGIANGGCVMSPWHPSTVTLPNSIAVTLQNSIVANSKGGNCYGAITSMGYNLSSDNTCHFRSAGDLNNTDPKLGYLRNNGGPTQTRALLPGSPAIDAGDPSGCTDSKGHLLKSDQRGMPRPDKEDSSGCDMGAFERQKD